MKWNSGWTKLTGKYRMIYLVICLSEFLFTLFWIYVCLKREWVVAVVPVLFLELCLERLCVKVLEGQINENIRKVASREMKQFQMDQRVLRHDFHIHLMAIQGMIDKGAYEDCKSYIQRIIHSSNEISHLMPLDDPAISAMLHVNYQIAKEKSVEIKYEIRDDLADIHMNAYEVNQILGNLINNAVEAVEHFSDERRWVHVLILKRSGKYIFRVENPIEGTVDDRIFSYGYSGKEGHSGIGLAGVRSLVSSYKGSLFQEQQEGQIAVIASIPIT